MRARAGRVASSRLVRQHLGVEEENVTQKAVQRVQRIRYQRAQVALGAERVREVR
jgi:hypothetical protein